jgi:hypothetical protein
MKPVKNDLAACKLFFARFAMQSKEGMHEVS